MIRKYIRRYAIQLGILGLLFTLLGLFILFSPQTFLSPRIYISFGSTIPFITLLALSLTFLVVAGELDLSFPSVMAISGFAFAEIFLRTNSGALGLLEALAVGGFAGWINGLLVVRVGVPSIIATIGTQFFWRGLSALLADGLARNIAEVRETTIHHLLVGRIFDAIPAQSVWAMGIAVLMAMVLNRHPFGENVLFIGDDIKTARLVGIPAERVRILLFVAMGVMSGLVAVMVCVEMANWWPTQGEGYMLLVFAAIFIGGTSVFGGQGTIFGTFVGAIIIGCIEAGIISAGLSGFWTRLVHGFVLVVSVSIYATIFRTGR
jgi:simple sugar transport system permease protein